MAFRDSYKKWFLLILVSIVFTKCGFIPCQYYSNLNKFDQLPSDNFLSGRYSLNDKPLNFIENAELVLNTNKTFVLKNIPVNLINIFYQDFVQNTDSLHDITGNWDINYNYSNEVVLSIAIEYSKIDSKLEDTNTYWELYKQDNKPVVLIILGDPDSCEALSFKKVN